MSGATAPEHAPMRMWLPSLLVAALGWGSSFLFIKMGLEAFTPAQVGFGRLLVGAAVLVAMVAFSRRWPHFTWKQVGAIAVVGVAGLNESLQWYEPIGALVVFVGVWLAGRSRPKPPPPPAATPPGAPSVD